MVKASKEGIEYPWQDKKPTDPRTKSVWVYFGRNLRFHPKQHEARRRVMDAANGICSDCPPDGVKRILDAHHAVPFDAYLDARHPRVTIDDLAAQLVPLCGPHHLRRHVERTLRGEQRYPKGLYRWLDELIDEGRIEKAEADALRLEIDRCNEFVRRRTSTEKKPK